MSHKQIRTRNIHKGVEYWRWTGGNHDNCLLQMSRPHTSVGITCNNRPPARLEPKRPETAPRRIITASFIDWGPPQHKYSNSKVQREVNVVNIKMNQGNSSAFKYRTSHSDKQPFSQLDFKIDNTDINEKPLKSSNRDVCEYLKKQDAYTCVLQGKTIKSKAQCVTREGQNTSSWNREQNCADNQQIISHCRHREYKSKVMSIPPPTTPEPFHEETEGENAAVVPEYFQSVKRAVKCNRWNDRQHTKMLKAKPVYERQSTSSHNINPNNGPYKAFCVKSTRTSNIFHDIQNIGASNEKYDFTLHRQSLESGQYHFDLGVSRKKFLKQNRTWLPVSSISTCVTDPGLQNKL